MLFILFANSVYSKAYEGDDDGRRKKIIGAILDLSSRAGKEEKVALDLAMEDFYPHLSSRPTLLLRDSMKDPVRALYSGEIGLSLYLYIKIT